MDCVQLRFEEWCIADLTVVSTAEPLCFVVNCDRGLKCVVKLAIREPVMLVRM
jgi:hypothetical protein